MASSLMEDAPLASLPSFLSLERSLGLPIGPAADTELNKGLTISGLKESEPLLLRQILPSVLLVSC